MKIIASILVMYFSLLMMQPFANMACIGSKPAKACSAGGSCKHMSSQHKGRIPVRYPSTCNNDFCNPFVPCGISIVQSIKSPNFANPMFDIQKNKKPTTNENITSAYLADCWRPPELS
jgi:hypothetical protein